MLAFRSEAHVDKWCRDWRMAKGAVLSLEQCRLLAAAWYSDDRRSAQWRRRTISEAQALFTQLGFTDAFWNLSP